MTADTAKPIVRSPDDLQAKWHAYLAENPKTRIRDVADALHVTEAELLATRVGNGVTRLAGDFKQLIERLHKLGRLLALTRNAHCVHEKKGVYEPVKFFGPMGQITGDAIDLRLFMSQWAHGFAEVTADPDGGEPRRSLQFFDVYGTALHKVYTQPDSDIAEYERLVADYTAREQSREQPITPTPPADAEQPDSAVDAAALLEDWRALQDTHDFFALLRKHKVSRTQALRIAEVEFTRKVDARCYRDLFEKCAAADGLPIMIFVRSPGLYQIHVGPINKIVVHGDWFNIMDPGFTLHLHEPGVAHAWVVNKPTKHGGVTSVELYDKDGAEIALMFTKRKDDLPESEVWRGIVAGLT